MKVFLPRDLIHNVDCRLTTKDVNSAVVQCWNDKLNTEKNESIQNDVNENDKAECLEKIGVFMKDVRALARNKVITIMIKAMKENGITRFDGQDYALWNDMKTRLQELEDKALLNKIVYIPFEQGWLKVAEREVMDRKGMEYRSSYEQRSHCRGFVAKILTKVLNEKRKQVLTKTRKKKSKEKIKN